MRIGCEFGIATGQMMNKFRGLVEVRRKMRRSSISKVSAHLAWL